MTTVNCKKFSLEYHRDHYLDHQSIIFLCDLFWNVESIDVASYVNDATPYFCEKM